MSVPKPERLLGDEIRAIQATIVLVEMKHGPPPPSNAPLVDPPPAGHMQRPRSLRYLPLGTVGRTIYDWAANDDDDDDKQPK